METKDDSRPREQASTVLLDFDGVVRHFDKSRVPAIEARHGLPDGSLRSIAFSDELLTQATTGKISRAEWTRRVGEAVGNIDAAQDWLGHRGVVDEAMIQIVDGLRARGIVVAILTNGTETVPAEADELGITDSFDAIFTTATIGFAKPDPRAFLHVCAVLRCSPESVFFTDDTESKLAGAIEVGMTARLFEGRERFERHIREFVQPSTQR